MLELKKIVKIYKAGELKVVALKGVSLSFRDNEFVSVLGPSGCGKTTLLNLVGGLDRFSDGDLIINGRSTKLFKDRDWDLYRNHSVGFVFQSYNLIPHQTVLGNVELALTIAGLPKKERVAKAKAALIKVGLEDQINKKPNQLSGGQCQRVAIARALVNDPDILLADEPTGALDSETSVQIMGLIKEIASERLVIMVTHNPELAEEYSTRIIKLKDGELVSDSNPLTQEECEVLDKRREEGLKVESAIIDKELSESVTEPKEKTEPPAEPLIIADPSEGTKPESNNNSQLKKKSPPTKKAKMSFWTAFKLSVHNLLTKKRRTTMTAIAGAVGIIGISLVLSLSIGLQSFIGEMQEDMLSAMPISITEQAFNINALAGGGGVTHRDIWENLEWQEGRLHIGTTVASLVNQMENMNNIMVQNEITNDYVDYIRYLYRTMADDYIATVFMDYGLNLSNNLFTNFVPSLTQRTNAPAQNISLATIRSIYASILGESEFDDFAPFIASLEDPFRELPQNEEFILAQYNLVEGTRWATEPGELMLVANRSRRTNDGEEVFVLTLSDLFLAQLGFFTQNQFMDLVFRSTQNLPEHNPDHLYAGNLKPYFSIDEILSREFMFYPNSTVFTEGNITGQDPELGMIMHEGDAFIKRANSADIPVGLRGSVASGGTGIPMRIVGILEPKPGDGLIDATTLSSGFFYTAALREEIFRLERENPSSIVERLMQVGSIESSASMAGGGGAEAMLLQMMLGQMPDMLLMLVMAPGMEDVLLMLDPEFVIELLDNNPVLAAAIEGFHPGFRNFIIYTERPDLVRLSGVVFDFTYSFPWHEGYNHNTVATPVRRFGAAGSVNMMAAIAGMFDFGGDMGGMMDAFFGGATLSLRELSGRNAPVRDRDGVLTSGGVIMPSSINIYAQTFASTDVIRERLDAWNNDYALSFLRPDGTTVTLQADVRGEVTYNFILGFIMGMLNQMVFIITVSLIGLVSLSLIVSTVMIAIITYVSVVERTKEIGVLRSLGARKRDVARLFNAETFIIGMISGLIAIIFTYISSAIINAIINVFQPGLVIAVFPIWVAAIMVGLSVFLTLISGLIPSQSAAKKDPVVALRTE
ncbi:MAG: ABC transporter ATP-binding protein/permease [Firmicutes bacterium]|nr:ABC transporter ATP-binding protein/permease [Bacillota bacterium]